MGKGIKMNVKAVFIIMALIALPGLVMAQQTPVKETNHFILTTNPPGATAYFYGEYNLVINTPAILPTDLEGKYKVRITRPGYEPWQGELALLPESPDNININLSQKTRFKAGLRSLFIPGWGQYYAGNTTRGLAFTSGIIATSFVLYYADKKYQDKRTSYDIANRNYSNAGSIAEQIQLQTIRDTAQRNAYKAETDRRRVFYIGMGLWIYNILDSTIFFPEGSAYYPTVSTTDGGGAQISFVVKF
jgi:hypothetical protein